MAYTPTGNPAQQTRGVSAQMRQEFAAIDTALDLKADLASPTFTGTPAAPTAVAGTSTTQLATCAFVVAQAFSAELPGQTSNSGKFLTTDGANASWAAITPDTISSVAPMTVTSGTSQTAAANNHYVLTNVAATNVDLPAGSAGDVVIVTIANGLATNTITPNGTEEIEGSNTAMTLDITAGSVWLRYVDNTKDWRLL
jgi:hypothetical protein